MRRRTGDGQVDLVGDDVLPLATLLAELGRGSALARRHLFDLAAEATGPELGRLTDELATAASNGCQHALEVLLAIIADRELTGPALQRLVSDRATIDDLNQEVLVAVAHSIHQFRGDARFTTWLYTLTRNVAVSQLRRQRPGVQLAADDVLGERTSRRMSSVVAERSDVRQAIASLPDPFRDAVVLRDIEGLSYAEIADRQGVGVNTVRSRLSRGRALLVNRVS